MHKADHKTEENNSRKPCIFFDRDGVVNESPGEGYVEVVADFHILPEFVEALRVASEKGYLAVVVTNQRCVSINAVAEEYLQKMHEYLLAQVDAEGLEIADIYYCPHGGDHPDRKPAPGMLLKAAEKHNIDLSNSWMIGDSERDAVAGNAAGCRTILVKDGDVETVADFKLDWMSQLPGFLEENLAAMPC